MKTILMVCTGNLCRSPMAEGLLRDALVRDGLAGEFAVASAGVWAVDDRPATEHGVQAMLERNIDISGHRSRNVTEEMAAEAALILTMTSSHAEALRLAFPAYADKVYLLSEMGGARYDIKDPIGEPLSEYQETARELAKLIESGYKKILTLAGR